MRCFLLTDPNISLAYKAVGAVDCDDQKVRLGGLLLQVFENIFQEKSVTVILPIEFYGIHKKSEILKEFLSSFQKPQDLTIEILQLFI